MVLRLWEHAAGIEGPVLLHRDTDNELLGLGQVPVTASIIQEADVAVVRRDGSDEVVQEEVAGQREAADEADQNHHDLKPPESVDGV